MKTDGGTILGIGDLWELWKLDVTSHKKCQQGMFKSKTKQCDNIDLDIFKGASRVVLNGRLVEEDHCLRPLNQRDAIVRWSMLKKSMSLSLRRILSQTAKPQDVLV